MYTTLKKWTTLCALLCLIGCAGADGQNRSQNIEQLFEALALKEGAWVADIGSREGFFTVRMAPIVGETGHIFAVDIDADALEDLHENMNERDIQNVTPVYSVQDNPMLPANMLDAVLIRNTYHEFTEPVSMLNHIKRALKPEGRLVIAEPISDQSKDDSRQQQAQSHDISMNYVKEDLDRAGFRVIEEVEHFSDGHPGDRIWLIIARRTPVKQ